ncbi:MAG: hypothetical protein QW705_05330 [Zestosphaera sp.]
MLGTVRPWYEALNPGVWAMVIGLRFCSMWLSKHGKEKVQEVLGVSRVTMLRFLNGKARVDDEKLELSLSSTTEDEFRGILEAREVLEAAGVI